MTTELVTGHTRVRAVLADPAYRVPPAPPCDETGTLGWLRAQVARFAEGAEHDHRRALAEAELARLDLAGLRSQAARITTERLTTATQGQPFDAMTIATRVPVAVLARELGIGEDVVGSAVEAVIAAASGYLNPDVAGSDADSSVRLLAELLGPAVPEVLANQIGLLMQACQATAGLIGNALIAGKSANNKSADNTAESVDEIIRRTLADDPPTLRTRRVTPDGELVTVDISGCTFGAGRRPCPGADQAIALASGVLDAMLPVCELADQQISYLPSPNLRIPAMLLITLSE